MKKPGRPYSNTKYYSYCRGLLAEGCVLCVRGKKMVLFITGLCGQRCFYCPVSGDKFGRDVIYANEWEVKDPKAPAEMLEECRLTEATGCGITGGDPLVKIGRTCEYIKLLKREFGRNFHVHLYTPMNLVNEQRLKALFDAGLDEIRFHPNLDDNKDWGRIDLAKKYSWKIGAEIPLIPGYGEKTKKLMDFLKGRIGFLNLNELEFSDTNAAHYKLDRMDFKQKDSVSYGVWGSVELGKNLLDYAAKRKFPYSIHLCTARLKNLVQMGERLKIRAKNSSDKFDVVTKDGFLFRGAAYLKGFEPGFDYQERLEKRRKEDIIALGGKMKETEKIINKNRKNNNNNFRLDLPRMRLLMSAKDAKRNAQALKKMGLVPALVREYPTSDYFTLELDFL